MRPTLTVAKELLGLYLVRRIANEILIGKIVECEAYLGEKDPASHAYRGITKRNEVMFRQGGHLYVYFTYGMHYCCNIVTEQKGTGHAVLLRAVEPVKGIEKMIQNRFGVLKNSNEESTLRNLCSGPAKLCQAFEIAGSENGTDLCGNTIWVARDAQQGKRPGIVRSTRVGITVAKHHRWRFYLKNNLFVSLGKPV
jgi:DNA-3-methyladenine glycosylase